MPAKGKTPQTYSSKATIEKLAQLEGELRAMLDDDLAPYVRVAIIQQLGKLAAQIEASRVVEVEESDPIEAIRLKLTG